MKLVVATVFDRRFRLCRNRMLKDSHMVAIGGRAALPGPRKGFRICRASAPALFIRHHEMSFSAPCWAMNLSFAVSRMPGF